MFNAHELLGQVVFGLVDNYYESYGTLNNYNSLVEFILKISAMKMFCYPFYHPLQLFKKLLQLGEESLVDQFYKTITSSILKIMKPTIFPKVKILTCQNQNCLALK